MQNAQYHVKEQEKKEVNHRHYGRQTERALIPNNKPTDYQSS
jgi:hypothetical protein